MNLKRVLIFAFVIISSTAQSDTLVLSDKLKLEYARPLLISHTENQLTIKYPSNTISHNIVNANTMYPSLDLTGYLRPYIYMLFDKKGNQELPVTIRNLALQQREVMGLNNRKGIVKKKEHYELYASYDAKHEISHIFLLEKLRVHHFAIDGSYEYLNTVINGIKER
ncbi:hypothetical protein [Bermanella sp. R86510]|uniref:hypothetical protein n=1 Tax=unclassified Bermanella TaxID=2627862 RepID=UPI0037C771AB